MIRRIEPRDVREIADIHLQSFRGFFLSFLGPRFLVLYYAGVCSAPEGIGFVYLNSQDKPAAFVVGTSNPRGFYSRLLKRDWLKFLLASIGPMIKKPSIIKRLARALLHPASNPTGDEVAGLFSIGVSPELQGSGIGKELVSHFLNAVKIRGCNRVFLTTDRDSNDAANRFYHSLGFQIERQYVTPEGRRMNEYWMKLS